VLKTAESQFIVLRNTRQLKR